MIRFLLASIAAFAVILSTDFLFHHIMLSEAYTETASLWRSAEEVINFRSMTLSVQLLTAIIVTFIFNFNFKDKGIIGGILCGLSIGLLLGLVRFVMVAYVPIPMALAMSWFAINLVQWLLVGSVISLIYCPWKKEQ